MRSFGEKLGLSDIAESAAETRAEISRAAAAAEQAAKIGILAFALVALVAVVALIRTAPRG